MCSGESVLNYLNGFHPLSTDHPQSVLEIKSIKGAISELGQILIKLQRRTLVLRQRVLQNLGLKQQTEWRCVGANNGMHVYIDGYWVKLYADLHFL